MSDDAAPELITDYEGLLEALIRRRKQLRISANELNDRAGLQNGYCEKLEAWRHGSKSCRGIGTVSLPLMLGALGLAIRLVEVSTPKPMRPMRDEHIRDYPPRRAKQTPEQQGRAA